MINKYLYISLLLSGFVCACSEKEFDPNDAAGSFVIAREPYDDENFEIALTKLGEFKSRFPYSQFAATAELFIANSQFELGRFVEAAATYEQFVKLHPKHEQVDFAMFRIGECNWSDAPEEIDRDQDQTQRAIQDWQRLVDQIPASPYAKQAKELIAQGQLRIASNLQFVVRFYYRMEKFHACAYRALELAEKYPQFAEIRNDALALAADSLDKVAKQKEVAGESDKNVYFSNLSPEKIREKATAARALLPKGGT